jgi:hypothetical protein
MSPRASLLYKIYGQPPAPGAPRSQALRWVRRFYIRPLPLTLALAVWILFLRPTTFALVLLGVAAGAWVWGISSLTLRIRREEGREQARPASDGKSDPTPAPRGMCSKG